MNFQIKLYNYAILCAILIFNGTLLHAQTQAARSLLCLHEVSNLSNLNAITSPQRGNIVHMQDNLYYYDGSNWRGIWSNFGNRNIGNNGFIGTTNNQDLKFRTQNTQRMVIKNDGNVGINTNDPSGVFEVNFNDGYQSISNFETNTSGITYHQNLTDNNFNTLSLFQSETSFVDFLLPNIILTRVMLYSDNPLAVNGFDPDNPTRIIISGRQTNWNWVVLSNQTYTPQSWLSDELVNINQIPLRRKTIDLNNNTPYDEYRIQLENTQHNPIHVSTIYEIELFVDKFSELIIIPNSNVGLSLDNPTQKLHVNGNILASGTITPDYVFEHYFEGESPTKPNYILKPIEEVKTFVKENKHLPGVPSTQDIKKQGGIIVNKATEINLEKIEELYLYLFELVDENDKIEKRISYLEEKLKELGK